MYLRSGDAFLARQPLPAKTKEPRAPVEVTPPAARDTSVAARVNAPGSARTTALDESLSARRGQFLRRIEDLSNDEADSVCLTMQLIPREEVFDHGEKPKKLLVRYIKQASSQSELDFLERTLGDLRH
ncbi:MAG: hypothetical protein P4L99_30280 [Chthoniobacter sp.]|nr:hypothetical protein [Chthoniobacter sp.]